VDHNGKSESSKDVKTSSAGKIIVIETKDKIFATKKVTSALDKRINRHSPIVEVVLSKNVISLFFFEANKTKSKNIFKVLKTHIAQIFDSVFLSFILSFAFLQFSEHFFNVPSSGQ
jgi:hypothetical protein